MQHNAQRNATQHRTSLHRTAPHSINQQSITITIQLSNAQNKTLYHNMAQHNATQHSTTQYNAKHKTLHHNTAQRNATQHSIAQNSLNQALTHSLKCTLLPPLPMARPSLPLGPQRPCFLQSATIAPPLLLRGMSLHAASAPAATVSSPTSCATTPASCDASRYDGLQLHIERRPADCPDLLQPRRYFCALHLAGCITNSFSFGIAPPDTTNNAMCASNITGIMTIT